MTGTWSDPDSDPIADLQNAIIQMREDFTPRSISRLTWTSFIGQGLVDGPVWGYHPTRFYTDYNIVPGSKTCKRIRKQWRDIVWEFERLQWAIEDHRGVFAGLKNWWMWR